jgi:hypothetical protein
MPVVEALEAGNRRRAGLLLRSIVCPVRLLPFRFVHNNTGRLL